MQIRLCIGSIEFLSFENTGQNEILLLEELTINLKLNSSFAGSQVSRFFFASLMRTNFLLQAITKSFILICRLDCDTNGKLWAKTLQLLFFTRRSPSPSLNFKETVIAIVG